MNNLDINMNKTMAESMSKTAIDKLFEKPKKLKFFITGIAGFLGSHLAERLIKDGHEVIGVDNLVGGYWDNVPEGAKFYEADCLDRDRMYELLEGVDIVYHCASACHEGLSIYSPYYYSVNTFSTSMSVISAAIARKVKRFILCSSAARYGALATPFTEEMVPKPQDPYGIAKYASDLALAEMGNTHGMEWVVAVPHNIIGTRQKYDDPYRNVASIFINCMLQGKTPFIYGDGLQQRSFSFVGDIVDPLISMASVTEAHGEIFNIGPDETTTTILDLYRIIADIIGFKEAPNHLPDRIREVKVVHLSADKARKYLGYQPKKKLEDGLREMVEWIRERGTKPFDYHLPIEIESPMMPKTWKEKLY